MIRIFLRRTILVKNLVIFLGEGGSEISFCFPAKRAQVTKKIWTEIGPTMQYRMNIGLSVHESGLILVQFWYSTLFENKIVPIAVPQLATDVNVWRHWTNGRSNVGDHHKWQGKLYQQLFQWVVPTLLENNIAPTIVPILLPILLYNNIDATFGKTMGFYIIGWQHYADNWYNIGCQQYWITTLYQHLLKNCRYPHLKIALPQRLVQHLESNQIGWQHCASNWSNFLRQTNDIPTLYQQLFQ